LLERYQLATQQSQVARLLLHFLPQLVSELSQEFNLLPNLPDMSPQEHNRDRGYRE